MEAPGRGPGRGGNAHHAGNIDRALRGTQWRCAVRVTTFRPGQPYHPYSRTHHVPPSSVPRAVHAAIPLAVLEAVQGLDAPERDSLDEFHEELTVKRLGLSRTVAQQVERFRRLARGGARADNEEFVALLRLISRRPDAALVFTDAGRRVARFAAARLPFVVRLVPRLLPKALGRRLGLGLAAGRARAVLGVRLARADGIPVATLEHSLAVRATPTGAACALYGSALAELLRLFTDFDGAMLHTACAARGAPTCEWRAAAGTTKESVS